MPHLPVKFHPIKYISLVPLLFIATTLPAQDFTSLSKYIAKQVKKKDIAGLSIAIVSKDSLLWEKGFGMADKTNQIKASANTVYPIGSVSKIITASVVMRLVQEGKVDLDAPYTQYVPDFDMQKHFDDQISFTPRDLLTHFAGIPRVRALKNHTDHPEPFCGLIEEGKEEYLIAPPKTLYQYSDWGMALLGCLIENVSGISYEEFVAKEVFLPIGMETATAYPYSQIPNLTKGYDKKGKETKIFTTRTLPADGIKASVHDLSKLLQVYLNKGQASPNRFLSEQLVKEMLTDQTKNFPLGLDHQHGLGWFLGKYYDYTTTYHFGDQLPCIAGIIFFPEQDFGVAILSNTYKPDTGMKILYKAVDHMLELKSLEKKAAPKPDRKKISTNAAIGKQFQGRFATPIGVIEIKQKNHSKMKAHLWAEQKTLSGTLYNDSTIVLRKMGAKILELKIKPYHGEDYLIYHDFGKWKLAGKRIKEVDIPKEWKATVGTYKVRDFEGAYEFLTSYKMYLKDGLLIGEGTTIYPTIPTFQIVLRPINNQQAIVEGAGGDLLGETVPLESYQNKPMIRLAGFDLIKQ
ncbi:serine hydrolase domain-containing protein [Limibacter armeniacum]|uniref:serine hydrolase domain-containing protein n=1 Tax=Limibacter armeniacum TaxID=466084 RepID=UPI002FE59864